MLTIARYFGAELARPTLLALIASLALVWLLQSLRFLDLVVNKGLGLFTFLQLTGLLIPMLLTTLVPISLLVGSCVVLRRWQEDNELTAMLATGRSPIGLLVPMVGWSLVLVAASYALFLIILPASTSAFKNLQYQIRTQEGQLLLEEGTFNQLGDNLMVYLQRRSTPTQLQQLLVHDTRVPGQPVTWYAKQGEVILGPDGFPQLSLTNGLRQEVGPKQVNMLEFKRYNLDIRQQLNRTINPTRQPGPEELSLPQLRQAAATTTNLKERHELNAEAEKRLLWPLSPLVMVVVVAGMLLRPPQRMHSSWRWVVGAAILAMAYFALQLVLFGQTENGLTWAIWGQRLLPVATIALGLVALWHANRSRCKA